LIKLNMMNAQALKIISLVWIWLLVSSFAMAQEPETKAGGYHTFGRLVIHGASNVNTFELTNEIAPVVLNNTTMFLDSLMSHQKKYWIIIPAKNFHTKNLGIYRDFMELIQADKFPFIRIGIMHTDLQKALEDTQKISFPVEIIIAGVSRSYHMTCSVAPNTTDLLVLNGSKKLKLTDFEITPPEKFFGIIKVMDDIMVNFDIPIYASIVH